MTDNLRTLTILISLSLVGVSSHLMPHDMGISTVGMLSMLCAAYLPRKLLLVPVLITITISDFINGSYSILAMAFVYLAHLLATLALMPTLLQITSKSIFAASFLNAFIFYLISNLTPMAMEFYPSTLNGFLTCYINGLPFLAKGIAANLIFGGLSFTIINWIQNRYAYRFFASQRH